jgi:hypothetical protein
MLVTDLAFKPPLRDQGSHIRLVFDNAAFHVH